MTLGTGAMEVTLDTGAMKETLGSGAMKRALVVGGDERETPFDRSVSTLFEKNRLARPGL